VSPPGRAAADACPRDGHLLAVACASASVAAADGVSSQREGAQPTPTTAAAAQALGNWEVLAGNPINAVQVALPAKVAVDGRRNFYVPDLGDYSIKKFSPEGELLARWGSEGSGPGQFDAPEGVAVDAQGNVYVADTGNNRVQRLAAASPP
jgi:DNA-binding beta-propeller fold protein YncE